MSRRGYSTFEIGWSRCAGLGITWRLIGSTRRSILSRVVRPTITSSPRIMRGRAQRQGEVVHIVAHDFERLDVRTDRLIRVSHDFR